MGLFDFFLKKHTKSNTNANSQDVVDSTHKMNTNNSICAKIEECDSPLSFSLSNVKSIDMGGLKLVPYDAYWYFSVPDATVLNLLANTDKLKEFMPGVDFSTEEKAKKALEGYMLRTEQGLGITYVIRNQNIPVGMIFVNTPKYNKIALNLNIWTVDFFAMKSIEHKKIMFNCLCQILSVMKSDFNVPKVYALVNKANIDCLKLIHHPQYPLFEEIDNTSFKDKDHPGESPRVFVLNLATMNFIHE